MSFFWYTRRERFGARGLITSPRHRPDAHITQQFFEDVLELFFDAFGIARGGDGGGDGIARGGSGDGIRRNVPSSSTLIFLGLSGFGTTSLRSSKSPSVF